MNDKKIKLENKIIVLEDFFKKVANELKKKAKFKQFHFLMPEENNGNFITKHSTNGMYINITKRELHLLEEDNKKEIYFPKESFHPNGFLRIIVLIKFKWKIKLYNISVIMPIYSNGNIICLILFTDQVDSNWFNKNSHYINTIRQEMTYCLETILLYNQALERIIRDYNYSNKAQSAAQFD